MPQELLIPVLVLRPKAWLKAEGAAKIHWEVNLGSAKVTTRRSAFKEVEFFMQILARSRGRTACPLVEGSGRHLRTGLRHHSRSI